VSNDVEAINEIDVACAPAVGGWLISVTEPDGAILWTDLITAQQWEQWLDGGPTPPLRNAIQRRLGGTWHAPKSASRGVIRLVRAPSTGC
jgi:hypothetical protein